MKSMVTCPACGQLKKVSPLGWMVEHKSQGERCDQIAKW